MNMPATSAPPSQPQAGAPGEAPTSPQPGDPNPPVAPQPAAGSEEPGGAEFAARFAQLRQSEARFRKEKEELAQTRKKYQGIENWKENPKGFLEAAGVNFQELADALAKQGQPPTPDDRFSELDTRLQQSEEARQALQDKIEQAEIDKNVNEYKANLKKSIEGLEGDRYEIIKGLGNYDKLYEAMNKIFKETEVEPSWEEVADKLENDVLEEARRYMGIPKIRSQLGLPGSPQGQQVTRSAGSTTLSNNLTPSAGAGINHNELSAEQSIAEAAKHIRWTEEP